MKKILICGNYGAKNIGDELILMGAKKLLKGFEIEALSEHKNEKYGLHHHPKFPAGLKSFFAFIFLKKSNLKALKSCDFFLLGGGNLFGGPSLKANIIWGIQAIFAIFYKKPLIIFCQSVGDKAPFFIKKLIVFIFEKSQKIYLRDEISGEILKEFGLKKETKILSDPALLIEFEDKNERKNTILSLRQIDNINEIFIEELSNFLRTKENIRFINFETGLENDEIISEKIAAKLKFDTSKICFNENPEQVLKEFSVAKLAICMRLHSIICAIITNTPFIAVSYAKKIDTFLDYAGLKDLLIYQKDITAENLEEKLKYLEKNKTQILQKIENFRKSSINKLETFSLE